MMMWEALVLYAEPANSFMMLLINLTNILHLIGHMEEDQSSTFICIEAYYICDQIEINREEKFNVFIL